MLSVALDWNKLIFGDQLQFGADGVAPTDDPAIIYLGMAHYFDFNAGCGLHNPFGSGFLPTSPSNPTKQVACR